MNFNRKVMACLAIALIWSFHTVVNAAENKRINVLVLGYDLKVDKRLQKELAAENVHLYRRSITDAVSPEMLKQFHVVFFGDEFVVNSTLPVHVSKSITAKNNFKNIEAYVRAGGGFLFTPDIGGYRGAAKWSTLMKPYEVKFLPLQIRDDKHRFVPQPPPKRNAGYSWTDKIAKHPATKGVKNIFYPTPQHRWDDFYSTPVVEYLSSKWKTLVQGMDSSTASWTGSYVNWLVIKDEPQSIASVRDFAKGRVGILNIFSFYTLWYPYWTPKDHGRNGRGQIKERTTGDIDGIFMEKGDGTRKSQGRELLIGMFRYLGEKAAKAGFGNYSEESFAKIKIPENQPAPAWLSNWNQQNGHKNYKVFVGARSNYSNGSGTLEEYAAAAKAADIAILCMAEPMEYFDLSKWREYYQKCQELSDDTLQVVPGLDMQDTYGARYITINSPVAPKAYMLSEDQKTLVKVEQLCINVPDAITIAHRVTSASGIPHQITKHFQGISLYTYNKDNELVDNSFPDYEWQMHNFSNPLPFVVHETDSPAKLKKASQEGFQYYVNAPSKKDLTWYFRRFASSHFWESPLFMQISSGPLLKAFNSDPFLEISSESKIKEVRLMYNYELYRRWTPNTTKFTVEKIQMPRSSVNWGYVVATDENGGKLISSGIKSGRQVMHTWRCGDRQNWWSFPNIYTGTDIKGFDLVASVAGTDEGAGGPLGFPQQKGPQRGDNLAPILDFSFASPEVYIQDVYVDQRYYRAVKTDIAFDAKPANATTRSRIFKAHIRYHQFYEEKKAGPELPILKTVEMTLRRPVTVETDIYPVVTSLNMRHFRLRGDMGYAYSDPKTGKEVTGILKKGTIDIPAGGRIGGLVVVDGTLRVARDNRVGFPAPADDFVTLPRGYSWNASFITVPPEQAECWRKLIFAKKEKPFEIALTKGEMLKTDLVSYMQAKDYTIIGKVTRALADKEMDNLIASTSQELKTPPMPLENYRVPLSVKGLNGNWPVAFWQPDGTYAEASVFEEVAWGRLDITKTGEFFLGNSVMADVSGLRMAVTYWNDQLLKLEVNNPFNKSMKTKIWTNPAIKDKLQASTEITIPAGSSQIITLKK